MITAHPLPPPSVRTGNCRPRPISREREKRRKRGGSGHGGLTSVKEALQCVFSSAISAVSSSPSLYSSFSLGDFAFFLSFVPFSPPFIIFSPLKETKQLFAAIPRHQISVAELPPARARQCNGRVDECHYQYDMLDSHFHAVRRHTTHSLTRIHTYLLNPACRLITSLLLGEGRKQYIMMKIFPDNPILHSALISRICNVYIWSLPRVPLWLWFFLLPPVALRMKL